MPITFHPDGRITGATIQADVTGQLTNTGTQSGQILETIACMCDGRTVTVPSGSYTIADASAAQASTTSYQTATGSEINYTPPTGTKQLVYNYEFQFDVTSHSGLSSYLVQIDGTTILPSQRAYSSNYASTNWNHGQMRFSAGYTFDLNAGSDNVAQGKFRHNTWTSAKTIRVRFRNYNSSYTHSLHQNTYWLGSGASGSSQAPIKPTLYIQAIA